MLFGVIWSYEQLEASHTCTLATKDNMALLLHDMGSKKRR